MALRTRENTLFMFTSCDNGYNSRTAKWRGCTGQGMGDVCIELPRLLWVCHLPGIWKCSPARKLPEIHFSRAFLELRLSSASPPQGLVGGVQSPHLLNCLLSLVTSPILRGSRGPILRQSRGRILNYIISITSGMMAKSSL